MRMWRLGFMVAVCSAVIAQGSADESCSAMAYGDQNQIGTKIRIRYVQGVAIDAANVPVPGVCVGVFTEPDHRLIGTVKTDDSGKFRLPSIGRGTYRLVAEYQAFGVANSLVVVGTRGEKSVVVRMRPRGIDSTSYIEKSSPR
jgi:hypothetical protein